MSAELSYAQLKIANEARAAEEVWVRQRKRNLLVLIRHYLEDAGFLDTIQMLSKEAGPALGQWIVCDNIDLATVLQEYEAYCYVKFKKFPKIAKRRTGGGGHVIICPLVNPIPNGDTNPSRSPIRGPGGSQVGTVVTYTCGTNFELRGESTRTCLESGEWNRPEPFCAETKCPEFKLIDIPNNVPEAKKQLRNARNYQQLLFKPYYNRRIEGDLSEGSKAYLICVNGWKLMKGTPAVQTCVSENGALVWTTAGTCVYYYSYPSYG